MTYRRMPGLTSMTKGTINPRYGDASQTAPPWEDIDRRLAEAQLYWLITVRVDGRPHAVPLCGVWHEEAFYFCTGEQEQKMRNLEANAHVAITAGPLGANGWSQGKDIVVEGRAERVTDNATLQRLADAWLSKYGDDWRFAVQDGGFVELTESGDGTGGLAQVFRVAPAKAIVFGDAHGQTTYRLSAVH
jgi:nitroimidazol reductase NimA-like FMN-containing flavoprotein (pyridoxamine 5'-phosphate oxidase superfamily)